MAAGGRKQGYILKATKVLQKSWHGIGETSVRTQNSTHRCLGPGKPCISSSHSSVSGICPQFCKTGVPHSQVMLKRILWEPAFGHHCIFLDESEAFTSRLDQDMPHGSMLELPFNMWIDRIVLGCLVFLQQAVIYFITRFTYEWEVFLGLYASTVMIKTKQGLLSLSHMGHTNVPAAQTWQKL